MDHYVGIDLHSTNNYIAIIDHDNKRVFKKKTKNDLRLVVEALTPYQNVGFFWGKSSYNM